MLAKEYKNKDISYTIIDGAGYLANLKKINIFVGANNSGKSRFLRQIFKAASDDFVFFDNNDLNEKLRRIFQKLKPKFTNLFYMNDLASLIESRTGAYSGRFNDFCKKINEKTISESSVNYVSDLDVANAIRSEMQALSIYQEIPGSVDINRKHIYIPILRGLRHLDFQNELNEKKDVYKIRTEQDYKLNIKDKDVFSGLSVYEEIKKMLLGSKQERKFMRDFEDFISKSFFQGKDITLVPDHDSDILKININDKDDREIFNVGDGIQSIIINTFQAFKYQSEDIVLCVEEPEMMMHPSVQRILIETLTTKFDKIQVFLTTHSNHFLDLTYDYPNDVAIFSFEEIESGKFNIKNVDSNAKILDLLGVRNSSVFLSNCVIWTEGVTDRMLLRKLLEVSGLDYKEDYHYTFAEYGGCNLENFDFIDEDISDSVNVQSITKNNYLIADNDNIKGDTEENCKNKKYIRRKKIKKFLGGDNFFDKHIEIENLIPYKIWKKVLEPLLSDKTEKKITLKISQKNDEENFNKELENEKIGILLKKYLIEVKDDNEPKYFKSEGIQCLGEDKKKIMKEVITIITTLKLNLKDFPQLTQELISSLKKFIGNSNKKR